MFGESPPPAHLPLTNVRGIICSNIGQRELGDVHEAPLNIPLAERSEGGQSQFLTACAILSSGVSRVGQNVRAWDSTQLRRYCFRRTNVRKSDNSRAVGRVIIRTFTGRRKSDNSRAELALPRASRWPSRSSQKPLAGAEMFECNNLLLGAWGCNLQTFC